VFVCVVVLPPTLLEWIAEHTPVNTVSTYAVYQKQYIQYCLRTSTEMGTTESACSFIRDALENRGLARATLTSVIPSAISDLYKYTEHAGLTTTPLMRAVKKVVLRMTAPAVSKLPVTKDHLYNMVAKVTHCAQDIRDMFLMILMFMGFLRESEAVALTPDDLFIGTLDNFEVLYVKISPLAKNDKDRNGSTVILSGSVESPLCPLKWFNLHTGFRRSTTHVFHQVDGVKPLATKTPNFIFKKWLVKIGVDPKPYGSHSLRRGGVTTAAANNIKVHVLKRHGRWVSDAIYLYLVDPTETILSVSRSLLEL
jgi:site-specific recombinase XerD